MYRMRKTVALKMKNLPQSRDLEYFQYEKLLVSIRYISTLVSSFKCLNFPPTELRTIFSKYSTLYT